jgi:colanic acid biosynthesis glycosyl transferase WcaI
VIEVLSWLERWSYRLADAVTVLSDDLADNVAAKLPPRRSGRVRVIPNFVDTSAIEPGDRLTAYRDELGLGRGPVVLYAGNIGFSQSLDLVLAAARRLPEVRFLVNGDGSARPAFEHEASTLPNVTVAGYVASERLGELLATGDVHLVVLKAGLGRVSVPSKTYSIMAAGRPVLAAIDAGTAVPRMLDAAGAGVAVPPDDPDAFVAALRSLLDDPERAARLGASGRRWVESHASPAAVGTAYDALLSEVASSRRRRRRR